MLKSVFIIFYAESIFIFSVEEESFKKIKKKQIKLIREIFSISIAKSSETFPKADIEEYNGKVS